VSVSTNGTRRACRRARDAGSARVKSVAQFIGRAALSGSAFGSERGELLVRLASDADASQVTGALPRARRIAGFTFDISNF
jgi:hypothetical protein